METQEALKRRGGFTDRPRKAKRLERKSTVQNKEPVLRKIS
ncbi:hypothetical protein [Neobacillus drentensis]|nr:hypothetical protein [Neobacillus drentensis]MDR7239124.1 hypothetical protein [Neobacillus drentensis]